MARIVVIEDEPIVAHDLKRMIEGCGHTVVAVTDMGTKALAAVAEHTPDLALLDIRLRGDMNGVEVARRIAESHDVAIVFLTAHSDPDTLARAQELRPYGFLVKPIAQQQLRAMLTIALTRHQADRDARARERQQLRDHARLEERVRISERLASLGTIAASVAHEISNPLTYSVANQSFLATELEQFVHALSQTGRPAETTVAEVLMKLPEVLAALRESRDGTEQVIRIVRDLKTVSRPSDDAREVISLQDVVDVSVRMAWNEIRHRALLETDYKETPRILGNAAQLVQLVTNLLVNAAQALDESGTNHRIAIALGTDTNGDALLSVKDTGSGIAPHILPRIFEPFFTTKPAGVGTGLGLPICRGIANTHGGELTAQSEAGKGSTFRLRLPAHKGAVMVKEKAPVVITRADVLIIDDDASVLSAFERALSRHHHVVTSPGADHALTLLAEGRHFDVIVCDLMMPNMTGAELHGRVREIDKGMSERMLFITGGVFTERTVAFVRDMQDRILEKPVPPDALLRRIQTLLNAQR